MERAARDAKTTAKLTPRTKPFWEMPRGSHEIRLYIIIKEKGNCAQPSFLRISILLIPQRPLEVLQDTLLQVELTQSSRLLLSHNGETGKHRQDSGFIWRSSLTLTLARHWLNALSILPGGVCLHIQ